MKTHDTTNSSSPPRNTLLRPNTSPSEPDVTMTAAPTSEYPVTAHCSVVTSMPVSSLIAGSRMLTAEVFAFTTRVDRHVAASSPRAVDVDEAAAVTSPPPGLRTSSSPASGSPFGKAARTDLLTTLGPHARRSLIP